MQPKLASLPLSSLERVHSPRAARKLAVVLCVLCLTLPPLLLFVPWQQNVPASGSVTAMDPLDRVQTIPVPVDGRLVNLRVAEGQFVEQGELLAEIVDQDANFALRLGQQLELAGDAVQAARDQVQSYDRQLLNLRQAKEHTLEAARFDLKVADDKVESAERERDGLEAEWNQKAADARRKQELYDEDLASKLDLELAQAAATSARAKLDAAIAKVSQEGNNQSSEKTQISRIDSNLEADIDSTISLRDASREKLTTAESKLRDAATKLARQDNREVRAPRDGYVMRVHAAGSADLLSQGEPLIELVPEADQLAVELFVRGMDAPLVSAGRKVRLQFDGWPAVQFAGWPSVAVGTFGGVVQLVDPQAGADGTTRILVLPDPEDYPWPESPWLRQNVRANAWLLLDRVSLGYEVWRQLNAFPPSLRRESKDGAGPKIGEKRPIKTKL